MVVKVSEKKIGVNYGCRKGFDEHIPKANLKSMVACTNHQHCADGRKQGSAWKAAILDEVYTNFMSLWILD